MLYIRDCIIHLLYMKPLLKKPSLDQNDLKSYRPVSNLSFIFKIFEKIVIKDIGLSQQN